ncbi:MAG TPA: fatty acid CoA ligase family protein [Opitutus sp.]|nr:fatty acid CoA ligase family protein [Opitutus sp.]
MSLAPSANIARHLSEMAARQPNRVALKIPRGRTASGEIDYLTLSFVELHAEVDAWCGRLTSSGVRRGDRTLVMVQQGLPLIAAAFALFKLGAVPVIIDPGMGLKSFLACVQRSLPRALIGIPLAQFVSRVARRTFATVKVRVSASRSLTARLAPPRASASSPSIADVCAVDPADLAAILFTSGSTGAPKGVCYEHGMFESQIRLIRETYGIQPGEIDLPMLPIFALFNPALGMTTVVPEIDPRRPAAVDPLKIVQAIQQENITNSFGSPTLWRIIGDHCVAQNITLPSLRRVLCAGAPVPATLWTSSRLWMPNGQLHSPYGATEALPVSSISADEIARVSGIGACVGRPVSPNQVKIITITDAPIASLQDAHELPRREIGEIIVAGPTVTTGYDAAPDATAAAKIAGSAAAPSSTVWHRMGDCGYLDDDGRLWFCGRKVERVETSEGTLFTEPCEQVLRTHPNVARCALIGLGIRGQQQPALVIESTLPQRKDLMEFARELRALAKANLATEAITRFYFHPKLPVDVRHNAKIHRLALARWATQARVYKVAS